MLSFHYLLTLILIYLLESNWKKFCLQSGYYQLPIFSQNPDYIKPIYYDSLIKEDRIPWATIQIRVETAPKDEKGKPIEILKVPAEKREELQLLKNPPKYSEALYNNEYVELAPNETKIFKEKAKRKDYHTKVVAKFILNSKSNDKKFVSKITKATKKKYDELNVDDVLNHIFENNEKAHEAKIDLNYFSQFIPEIGLKFSIDLMYNCDPNLIYVGIWSVNPPGGLYNEPKNFGKVVLYNEIDFKSYIRAQKFSDIFYSFVNVPMQASSNVIIDIKSIKFLKDGKSEINDYGWTIFPLFNILDHEDEETEIYLKSGIFMMPLIKGTVVNKIIEELKSRVNVWEYLKSQSELKVPLINFYNNSAVALRCVDNQRDYMFKTLLDWKQIKYDYWDNPNNYIYDQNRIEAIERGKTIESLLPKGKSSQKVQEEINKLISDHYGISD